MYMNKPTHIHFYSETKPELYITEFGHSVLKENRTVGPWVRDVWILHIVMKGTCHLNTFDVSAGEAFLLAKGKLHSFEAEKGYEHFWIAFNSTEAAALQSLICIDFSQHQHFQLRDDVAFLAAMLSACFEKAGDEDGEDTVIGILLFMLSNCKSAAKEVLPRSDVQSACAFMKHNYYRKMTMEEVAHHISLSEKHLCRLFKKELGITPVQYLIRMRMEQSASLLKNSSMLVKDIALTVGYPSQLAFSSAFSAFWGCCPTEYRHKKQGRHETVPASDQK